MKTIQEYFKEIDVDDIIERYNCGASVEKTTPEEIAKEIRKIKELNSAEYTALCNLFEIVTIRNPPRLRIFISPS